MASQDIRTHAIVLRRTNYGEADRILNMITPDGKIAVLAKGVRKAKSKLAGGIEPFAETEVVIHQGRSEFYTLTSAKTIEFYQNLLIDLDRLNLASDFLKKIARVSENVDSPDFFEILRQALNTLNNGGDEGVVRAWFMLNLAKASGEQINLIADNAGNKLSPDSNYVWDSTERALREDGRGDISANEIKLARLMLSAKLPLILKVSGVARLARNIEPIIRTL